MSVGLQISLRLNLIYLLGASPSGAMAEITAAPGDVVSRVCLRPFSTLLFPCILYSQDGLACLLVRRLCCGWMNRCLYFLL